MTQARVVAGWHKRWKNRGRQQEQRELHPEHPIPAWESTHLSLPGRVHARWKDERSVATPHDEALRSLVDPLGGPSTAPQLGHDVETKGAASATG